jgi:hypothetical protein
LGIFDADDSLVELYDPLKRTPGLHVVLAEGESNSIIRGCGHVCVVGSMDAEKGGRVRRSLRATLKGRPSHLTLRFIKSGGRPYAFRAPCRIDACLRALESMNGEDTADFDDDDDLFDAY